MPHRRFIAGLALALTVATAHANTLLGPIWPLQGKHIGDGEPLSWTISYQDSWGRTVVDGTGGHFYHDRCCGGYETADPSWVYPQSVWGQYPMYYIGTTMRYTITLTNNGNRTYNNLRVIAIQEYLTNNNTWGEWISPDAAKDWYVPTLGPGQSLTFSGSLYIPWSAEGGLDQTHLQVQHWNAGQGQPGPGSVIIDDTKAAIWCPPKDGAPGQPGSTASAAGGIVLDNSVAVAAGGHGYVSAGSPASLTVAAATAGDVMATVVDSHGNVVQVLSGYADGTQPLVLTWDGRTNTGTLAAPGIYLVTVAGPGIYAREKLAIVR